VGWGATPCGGNTSKRDGFFVFLFTGAVPIRRFMAYFGFYIKIKTTLLIRNLLRMVLRKKRGSLFYIKWQGLFGKMRFGVLGLSGD
jgi:hypothetical protein